MKLWRGKSVAARSVVLCLAAVIAGFTLKDRVVAEYYLWRLKSGEPCDTEAAADSLRKIGSRAVSGLLRIIAEDFNPSSSRVWCGNCRMVSRWYPASRVLEQMGKDSLPALSQALHHGNAGVREAAAGALRRIQGL